MITTYQATKLIYGSRALELKKSIKHYWIWNTDFFHRPLIPSDQAAKLVYGSRGLGLKENKRIGFKANKYKASRFPRIAARDQGTKIDISVGVQEEESFESSSCETSGDQSSKIVS